MAKARRRDYATGLVTLAILGIVLLPVVGVIIVGMLAPVLIAVFLVIAALSVFRRR